MEDYSTVIWVVVAVAAMVFNTISQARKKALKRASEAPKHDRHEAWPSWDTKSEDEMRHPDSQETIPVSEFNEIRPETERPAPMYGFEETTATEPENEQPAPMFGYEDTRKTAGSKRSGNHAVRTAARQEILHEEHSEGNGHTTQEAVTEITEDFDLRKAVIYSEILKPKFDE